MAKENNIPTQPKKNIAIVFFVITTLFLLIASVFLGINTAIQSQKVSELEYSNENLRKDNIDLRSQKELIEKGQQTQTTPQDAQILADYIVLFNKIVDLGTKAGATIIMIDENLNLLEATNTTDFTQVDALFNELSKDIPEYKKATQDYLDFFSKNEQTIIKYDKQNIMQGSKTVAEQDIQNIDAMVQAVQTRIQDLKKQLGV